MIIIGIDPHKRVHTASAVDAATNRRLATVEVDGVTGRLPAAAAVG